MSAARKIINDPVYGFITLDHPLLLSIISHPFYQRLRRIYQMAFAHLVYPGAVHTRLHHSLGAYHLMCVALSELKRKKTDISPEEELGAKIAILLHDTGHGPYSHALEQEIIKHTSHEALSLLIMQKLNEEFDGKLETAISIFTGTYPKKFLSQLVSGQLDVDRMDYLNRDSFFTGVAEGVIGYDRILKMLIVKDDSLMVEEKAIYSIEKFLVSRRLMYWQVYLHKTVLGAEKMLQQILKRAVAIGASSASPYLNFFLSGAYSTLPPEKWLNEFCQLDDHDIFCTLKNWQQHEDPVLSLLSRALINRQLMKTKLQSEPFSEDAIAEKKKEVVRQLHCSEEDAGYFVFAGEASNTTYDPADERIYILFKDGTVRDISEVDNALIQHNLKNTVKKYYICFWRTGDA
ncbi:MAG: HD domain-containing protein [Chitinophagaceae bacterium]|nr:HD domain-containing protein [Chitinophagaceae bacterium]